VNLFNRSAVIVSGAKRPVRASSSNSGGPTAGWPDTADPIFLELRRVGREKAVGTLFRPQPRRTMSQLPRTGALAGIGPGPSSVVLGRTATLGTAQRIEVAFDPQPGGHKRELDPHGLQRAPWLLARSGWAWANRQGRAWLEQAGALRSGAAVEVNGQSNPWRPVPRFTWQLFPHGGLEGGCLPMGLRQPHALGRRVVARVLWWGSRPGGPPP